MNKIRSIFGCEFVKTLFVAANQGSWMVKWVYQIMNVQHYIGITAYPKKQADSPTYVSLQLRTAKWTNAFTRSWMYNIL